MNTTLAVFGHTALDILLRVPKLPDRDSSIAVDEKTTRYGGTAANIARGAAEMDVDVFLVSFVGEDFPDNYRRSLKSSGVSLKGLKTVKGSNTPHCWIINEPDGDQITIIDQGVMKEAQRFEPPVEIITESEILHIGTGKPEYYKKIYEEHDLERKMIVFDPAQELEYMYEPPIFKEFLKNSDYFLCNDKEKKVALRYLSENSVSALIEQFNLKMVLVTQGAKGSTLYLPGEKIDIPAYEPNEFVEMTGAGDAFRAGFYAALHHRGGSLEEACKIGSARASFALEHQGSQKRMIGWDKVIARKEERSI